MFEALTISLVIGVYYRAGEKSGCHRRSMKATVEDVDNPIDIEF